MPTQPKQHNESLADLNGSGPTVDAEVHIPKPNVSELVSENKRVIIGAALAFVGGIILKDKLFGAVAKGAHKTAEVAEEVAD